MSSTDAGLGKKISEHLVGLGVETPMDTGLRVDIGDKIAFDSIAQNQLHTMRALGLDMKDDSLQDTPKRVAKMYCHEIFHGLDYRNFPKCTTVENKMKYDEVITVQGIDLLSMCEHHFVPFHGTAAIAYIPSTKVLRLSKFNRIVYFFCRRPQIQERLTMQIAETLKLILETEDVAVVTRAEHMCVKLRGVKQANTSTSVSKIAGRFKTKDSLRAEFFNLIKD